MVAVAPVTAVLLTFTVMAASATVMAPRASLRRMSVIYAENWELLGAPCIDTFRLPRSVVSLAG